MMVAEADLTGVSLIIVAVTGLITASFGMYMTWRGQKRSLRAIQGVDKKVDTLNETTMGGLAAQEETRRVEEIPYAERTRKEQRHVDESPPGDRPQGSR